MTQSEVAQESEVAQDTSPDLMTRDDIRKAISRIPDRAFIVTREHPNGEMDTILVTAQKHEIDGTGNLLFSNLHFVPDAPGSLASYTHRVFAGGRWLEVEEMPLPKSTGLTN